MALYYIHKNNIIHNNISKKSLFINDIGYIILGNFEYSTFLKNNNNFEIKGLPGISAPEIIFGQNFGKYSDYFSLGVLAYELMLNKVN